MPAFPSRSGGVQSPRSRRPGFTLIELIVTMAIVTVLVGLLLVAVQRVRAASLVAVCTNNLKQLALSAIQIETTTGYLPTNMRYRIHGVVIWYRHGENGLLRCPFASFSGRDQPVDSFCTYGFNDILAGKKSRRRSTSNTFLFGDSALNYGGAITGISYLTSPRDPFPTSHFRHPGGMAVSYLDGHVSSIAGRGQQIDFPSLQLSSYTGLDND